MMGKKIIIAIIAIFFVVGCGMKDVEYKAPKECYTADGELKPSIILDVVPFPRETAILLKGNTFALIKKDIVEKQTLVHFFDRAQQIVENSGTYADLFFYVRNKTMSINNDVGTTLLILSQYSTVFKNTEKVINECDKAILLKHLKEQRMIALSIVEGD